ncbi:hypothetical protein OS493_007851 [Desmophyllum pertusum]|uniref:Uncharacterized protein n=1 Tax=Desmophyllum pertusum TaxID=174260 RepID=A0A9W9YS22_9CNID|nr:hypothetical protein OS493_007851 [Desmophyllum pertusum]
MVLDNESCVHVFSEITAVDDESDDDECSEFSTSSDYLYKFPVAAGAYAIAFHWMSGHVIIASKSKSPDGPSRVSIYSKDGAFERNIQLELEKNDRISAAAVTTDGRICVCVKARDSQGKYSGKVLVL